MAADARDAGWLGAGHDCCGKGGLLTLVMLALG